MPQRVCCWRRALVSLRVIARLEDNPVCLLSFHLGQIGQAGRSDALSLLPADGRQAHGHRHQGPEPQAHGHQRIFRWVLRAVCLVESLNIVPCGVFWVCSHHLSCVGLVSESWFSRKVQKRYVDARLHAVLRGTFSVFCYYVISRISLIMYHLAFGRHMFIVVY